MKKVSQSMKRTNQRWLENVTKIPDKRVGVKLSSEEWDKLYYGRPVIHKPTHIRYPTEDEVKYRNYSVSPPMMSRDWGLAIPWKESEISEEIKRQAEKAQQAAARLRETIFTSIMTGHVPSLEDKPDLRDMLSKQMISSIVLDRFRKARSIHNRRKQVLINFASRYPEFAIINATSRRKGLSTNEQFTELREWFYERWLFENAGQYE